MQQILHEPIWQHSTAQHSTAQHSTAQHSMLQNFLEVKLFAMQNPEMRHRKEDIVHPLRQITTNPMKRGGFGFNKTTLSERKGYKGVVSYNAPTPLGSASSVVVQ